MVSHADAVAVIGCGPVGSILAAHLMGAGIRTYVVERGRRLAQIRARGIVVHGAVSLAAGPIQTLQTVEELAAVRDEVAIGFVCTKAWALRTVLPGLREGLREGTPLVSFQNGIGTEDEIAERWPGPVGRAVVNLAAGVTDDGDVLVHWTRPPNYLGPIRGSCSIMQRYAGALTDAGLPTEYVSPDSIRKKAFLKTILNASMNALCATTGITMKQAMQMPTTRALVDTMVCEGLRVASAAGYGFGPDARAQCLSYLEIGGDHLPSMCFDLRRNSRTEIDYMNGRIVEFGDALGAPAELNALFASLIVTLEIKSGARGPDDIPAYLTRSPGRESEQTAQRAAS
jgi:2-dehydropantoate 2-reductase